MGSCIKAENLSKSYGGRPALQDVSFSVGAGEVTALLGVNGAGKTTTLECLEGVREPDSGRIEIQGRLAAQLQSGSLPDFLRAEELVRLFARWNKVKPDPEMLHRLEIGRLSGKQYRSMSTGQKRRLHLALALLRQPDVLLLDEPTAGLDVEGRLAIHEEIRRLQGRGTAVLLATHDLSEVQELCGRLILLREGTVAFTGTPKEFSDQASMPASVCVRTPEGTESLPAGADAAPALAELLERCRQRDLPVLEVWTERGSLEEQFVKLAKGA